MWALAWRAPKDQQRDACADRADEPREFLMGRTTDPWRAAEAWIRCLASHGVPIHAATELSSLPELAHLPAEPGTWVRYDRSSRSRSDIRPASCSRPRVGRADCPVRHQSAGWHLLQAV